MFGWCQDWSYCGVFPTHYTARGGLDQYTDDSPYSGLVIVSLSM